MENIINITLKNPLHIKIDTENEEYLQMIKDSFTFFVDGYQYVPKYKSGMWDGTICLMRAGYTLPYGLLLEIIKINKRDFPQMTTIISDKVKQLFKGDDLEPVYDLKLFPYPYQSDCIEKALRYTKGIIRSTTASGKSLMIAYIVKTLLENKKVEQCLIVVPTKSLVEQFYSDLKDYDIQYTIGRVHQKYKEWDKDIVISTWQTLIRNTSKLRNFQTMIVDESHQVKSHSLSQLLKKSPHMQYRYGFTGTLHAGQLDNLNTFSYLGPVIAEYTSAELAREGYISKCNVNVINLNYKDQFEGDYNDVKDDVFTNNYRLSLIKEIVESVDHNILLLVGKVEKEGDYLKDWLSENMMDNKEIVFLSGRDDVKKREKWRKACLKRKDIVLIATYGIFSTGINIPNLKYTVLAAPFKSKIRVLQSIGRNLRKFENKEKTGAVIYDIHDEVKYLNNHGNIRARYYSMEGFNVDEMILNEGDDITLL